MPKLRPGAMSTLMAPARERGSRVLALLQGLYYLATGVWPLVDMGTFLRVTGGKTDLWLVNRVGALVAVVGLVLVAAGVRRRVSLELGLLGGAAAAALAAVDLTYVIRGRISAIYLLDAAVEIVLVLAWIASSRQRTRRDTLAMR